MKDYLNSISLLTSAFSAKNDKFTEKLFARICMTASFMDNDEYYTALCFALAFLYPSNPEQSVIDTIVSLGNSGSKKVVYASIITLAIIGAGSKSTQIFDFLEDQKIIFGESDGIIPLIKFSEGLVGLGVGTGFISKNHFKNSCTNIRGIVGLLSFLYIAFNLNEEGQTSNETKILCLLTKCFSTKIVTVIDENKNMLNEEVMIGTPINTIGVSGTPSDISAVQIFKSPVVIQNNEKGKIEGYENEIEDVIVLKK